MYRLFATVLSTVLTFSCSNLHSDILSLESFYDSPETKGVETVLKRAWQISQIRWTPIDNVPNNRGAFIAGEEVIGIPYSSAKELDKFVGLDVSFETFMTAVHNPRSVLYSENIGKDPYNGSNCATYYGAVCSSAINYALDLKANYTTEMIDKVPFFQKASSQSPESIKLCDILWSPGHEVMVYEIIRNEYSTIKYVTILESSGVRTRIHGYDFSEFCQRWKKDGWVNYRYTLLDNVSHYTPNPFVLYDGEPPINFKYNNIIALSRGNKCVFRQGEPVVLNVLDSDFTHISLYKNNQLVCERKTITYDETYNDLSCGSYTITASDSSGNESDAVAFEIVDTSVEVVRQGIESISVRFDSCYGHPEYVVLCKQNGTKFIIKELDEQEVSSRITTIPYNNDYGRCYCKVYFSTPNGMVTNKPIRIQ